MQFSREEPHSPDSGAGGEIRLPKLIHLHLVAMAEIETTKGETVGDMRLRRGIEIPPE